MPRRRLVELRIRPPPIGVTLSSGKNDVSMFPARVPSFDNPYITTLVEALTNLNCKIGNFNTHNLFRTSSNFHVHWPERIFHTRLSSRISSVASWYGNNLLKHCERSRDAGGRIAWTAHNLLPHDRLTPRKQDIWNQVSGTFFPMVTDVFLLSSEAKSEVLSAIPVLSNARFHVVYHQHYINFFEKLCVVKKFRIQNEIPEDAILFSLTGFLKPYKQVELVISCFKKADVKNSYLVICGKSSPEYYQVLLQARGESKNIIILPYAVSHSKLADIVSSSDASIFNFKSIFNSGSVMTSLSLETPVIVPEAGSLREIANFTGPDWMHFFGGSLSPEILQNVAAKLRNRCLQKPDLSIFDPISVAQRHLDGYNLN